MRDTRTDKDLEQEDLAVAAGVSQQMISRYENGVSLPKIIAAELIAERLDTTVRELYKETIEAYRAEMGLTTS